MVKIYDDLCSKGNAFYKALPPMKDGAIKSFVVSSAFSAVVFSNPTTAIMSGAVSALASVISSLAKPILEDYARIKMGDPFIEACYMRSFCVILAHGIITRGGTNMHQTAIFFVMNAAAILMKDKSATKSNETHFNLVV